MDIFGIEIPFATVVLGLFAAYFILVLIFFWICSNVKPEKFIQRRHAVSSDALQSSLPLFYMDCSGILRCCPCKDISFRQILKSCCCDSEKFWRSVNCECIRPAVHGSQTVDGLNCVCCQVGGTSHGLA
ncbi:unnamed protein product [Gongylonema pulchrum]|uniref:Uncharacterized protein n=1 Tax=Gongylonema pulchrum TaxID=637853 RepID=A0A183D6J4_9BILA|nr:unnamed protein product [Gongylonema pulchrum]